MVMYLKYFLCLLKQIPNPVPNLTKFIFLVDPIFSRFLFAQGYEMFRGSLKRFRDLIDFRTLNPNPIIESQLKIRRIHRIHRRIHTRIRYAGIKSDVLQYGDFRFFLFQHQPTVLPGSLARTKSAECQCPSPPLLPWYNGLLRISRKRRRW